MSTNTTQPTRTEKLRDAEDTRDGLGETLRALGVSLPSLGVETLAYAEDDPNPLIDLGRCNMSTARKLLTVLREHPAATRPTAPAAAQADGTDTDTP
jgi:hypothetical protein